MDCGNFMFVALNFPLIKFLKLTFLDLFFITQIVHSNVHFNPLQGVFSDKPFVIAFILNFQFDKILDSQETLPQKVLICSLV